MTHSGVAGLLSSVQAPLLSPLQALPLSSLQAPPLGTGTFSAPAAPPRPNTYMHYEMSSPHSTPMPPIPLNVDAWGELLARYPDKVFGQTVALIACCGAKLGYPVTPKNKIIIN